MRQKKQVKKAVVKPVASKPDFHVTDRILFVSLMLLVFSASATMAATRTTVPAKAPVAARTAVSTPAPVSACGLNWTKVLDADSTTLQKDALQSGNAWVLAFHKFLQKSDLQKMVDEGCSFKVVETQKESETIFHKESFTCTLAEFNANSNYNQTIFDCSGDIPDNATNAQPAYPLPLVLVYKNDGTVYYKGNDNNQDITTSMIYLSLFAKK